MAKRRKIAGYQIFWSGIGLTSLILVWVIYANIKEVMREDAETARRGPTTMVMRHHQPRESSFEKSVVQGTKANVQLLKDGKFFEGRATPNIPERQTGLPFPSQQPEDSPDKSLEQKMKSYYSETR